MKAKKYSTKFALSVFWATGSLMVKTFKLVEGKLTKDQPGLIIKGNCKVYTIDLEQLAEKLPKMEDNMAMALGTPDMNEVGIVTKAKYQTLPPSDKSVIPKDKEHFKFRTQPTLCLLDIDGVTQSVGEVLDIVASVFPIFAQAGKCTTYSSSSGLFFGGKSLSKKGGTSAHVFVVVQDGTDIPRFIKTLFKRLWLAGHGHIEISKAGSLLTRGLIDDSVGSPERLVYEAPPKLQDGITQDRPAPKYIPGGMLDSSLLPDLSKEEEEEWQLLVHAAKVEKTPEAERVAIESDNRQIEQLVKAGRTPVQAERAIRKKREGFISPEDMLFFAHKKEWVSVAEVLTAGRSFDGKGCCDPLEPDYNGGHDTVAKFYWNNGINPLVTSFAHGRTTYRISTSSNGRQNHNSAGGSAEKKPETPLPLVKKNERSEPFPFEALGNIMRKTCKVISKGVQAPDAIIALSVLAAANLAIQALRNIMIDGRVFPASLFMLSIAATGERKSAVDSIALAKHREIEKERISTLAENQVMHELLQAAYENDKNALIKDKKKSLEEKEIGIRELVGKEPKAPDDPTILVTDFTFEGLFKLFQIGTPSKGLFADEGGQVTGGHGMTKEKILATAAGLSKFWDGSRVDRIRVMDGFSHLYGRRLAMHLMMQDKVGIKFYTHDILTDQGLISRVLAAWPTSTVGSRKYNSVDVKSSPEMAVFYSKVEEAMTQQLPIHPDGDGMELKPPLMLLSPEAKTAWEAFYNHVEAQSGVKCILEPVRGLANKAAEHAARLGATIQLFEDCHSTEIKADAMRHGIVVMTWFLDEALRITESFAPDAELERAKNVLRWIHEMGLKQIPLPDVYQYSPVRSASQARRVMDILAAHYHVSRDLGSIDSPPEPIKTKSGGYSTEYWNLNPASMAE